MMFRAGRVKEPVNQLLREGWVSKPGFSLKPLCFDKYKTSIEFQQNKKVLTSMRLSPISTLIIIIITIIIIIISRRIF